MVMPIWRPGPNNMGPSIGDPAPPSQSPVVQNPLSFVPDGTIDIGATASQRPRNMYMTGSITTGGVTSSGAVMGATVYSTTSVIATSAFNISGANSFMGGSGVPSNAVGNNGDYFFRSDTPTVANQRIYVKSAGTWLGIV